MGVVQEKPRPEVPFEPADAPGGGYRKGGLHGSGAVVSTIGVVTGEAGRECPSRQHNVDQVCSLPFSSYCRTAEWRL